MVKRILALLVFTSCVTPVPDMGVPAQFPAELKPQLHFSVDGEEYTGVAEIPRQTETTLRFSLPEKTELVVVSSCARQEEFLRPRGDEFVYEFTPAMYTENIGSCLLSFIAVTSSGEFHRAIVDFTNPQRKELYMEVSCNGTWNKTDLGAAICSVREGLPVRVWPKEKTVIGKDPMSDCSEPKADGLMYEITAKKGFCIYYIMTKDKEFRLTLHGYTSFLNKFPPKE